jgi:hypothetical protein
MVSVKALGAIALTLVICVPIGLGYLLAVDEEMEEGWQTSDQYNISDMLLNSTTDYYMTYTGPGNNSTLIQSIYYPSGGVTETQQVAPSYVKVGTTYTSLPTYSTATSSYTMTAGSSTSYDLDGSLSPVSVGYNYDATHSIGAWAFIVMSINSTSSSMHWCLDYGSGQIYAKTQTVAVAIDGGYRLYNTKLPGGSVDCTQFKLITDADGIVTVGVRDYTAIAPTATSWSADLAEHSGIRLTTSSGTTRLALSDSSMLTVASSGIVSVGGTTMTGVTKVEVVEGLGYESLYYSYTQADGKYANPAYGWTIPTSGVVNSTVWINNQLNREARIMLSLPDGASDVYIGPTYGSTSYSSLTIHKASSGGTVTANGMTLGVYTYLMVEISPDGYTASGIKGWPSTGADPVTLNSVTVPATIGNFSQITLSGTTTTVQIRVDSTEMVAGSYPSTKDYTLALSDVYPDTAVSLKLNSIGVYGDTLIVSAGSDSVSYAVDNGKILIGETSVSLKGAMIAAIPTDGTWQVSINGYTVASFSSEPSIAFGGEWSLTVMAYKLETTTQTRMAWQPGEFAFDEKGFAAAGILVAGALLVILGMTGQRSSTKMGLLMLILGGAAMIYLTII